MENAPGQREVGHELKQYTSRLVELSMEVLKRQWRTPGVDMDTCRNSTIQIAENPPHHVLRKTWDSPVYDEADRSGNHRVDVRYERDTEIPGHNESDTLTLELRSGIKCACGAILKKPTDRPATDFHMTDMTVLSEKQGRRTLNFRMDEDVLKDSEIVSAMEQVLLEIITLLEQSVVGPKRREEILGTIRQLFNVG